MTNTVNTIIILVLILASILFGMTVHEMGHFAFAKIFKINVKEFSIGIGPKVFQWKTKKGMLVSLRWIPLMAYVMIDSKKIINLYKEVYDEHINDEIKIKNKLSKSKLSKNNFLIWWYELRMKKYYKQLSMYEYLSSFENGNVLIDDVKLWQKLLIFFGGVFVNLLCFFLFWLIQYFGFNLTLNPFIQLGESFKVIWMNMTFQGSGSNGTGGTGIGNIVQSGISGSFENISAYDLFKLIFNYLTIFNLMLFIYNLLPIPPLDGYKMIVETIETIWKVKTPKKVEIALTIIGYIILLYVFISSIIVDFI